MLTTIAADEQPAAWRQRRLVFSSQRLEAVVAEFNRLDVDPIYIEDPLLRSLRIGGVFSAGDPGSLLAFLEGLDGVTVRTAEDGTHIVALRLRISWVLGVLLNLLDVSTRKTRARGVASGRQRGGSDT